MRIPWLASVVLVALASPVVLAQDKPIVTVLDLQTESISAGEMRSVVSLLSSELFKTAQYTVIDVTERDRLLKEVEFSASDCTDESCQLEIGKMLSAEYILVGNVGLVGNKYVLSVKMLETESARTVGTGDGVYGSMEELIGDVGPLIAQVTGGTVRTARATVTARRVGAWVTLGGGVAGTGAGGVLLGWALIALGGSVKAAYQSYAALPPGTEQAQIDAAWSSYEQAFGSYRIRLIAGIASAGAGVALLGTSALLFMLPQKTAVPGRTAVSLLAAPGLRGIAVRLSY